MQDRITCLAVNTATTTFSVALTRGDDLVHVYETADALAQGNALFLHVQAALDKGGIDYPDLDLLAVVTGPGSFTGIRLGLAALRGLALAAAKPLIGITSFDLFAVPRADSVNLVAVESWRKELYFAVLDEEAHPLLACTNEAPEVFAARFRAAFPQGPAVHLSGDAAPALAPFFPQAEVIPVQGAHAGQVARLARARFAQGGPFPKPVPYYLREADVTISTRPGKQVETG